MKALSFYLGTSLLASALGFGLVASVSAQSVGPAATPGVDARQARQQARIHQGQASGQLTPREGARLQQGQAHVQRMENRAKADGVVTRGERHRLQHAQDVQSRKIHRKKHNNRHM